MKNIENISQSMKEEGIRNMLIHSVPNTANWLICHKIDEDRWTITLCNPLQNFAFNLGETNTENHLKVWAALIGAEIETRNSQGKIVRQYKSILKKFIINNPNIYAHIFKKTTDKKSGRTQKSDQNRISRIRHNAKLRTNKPENHIPGQKR